MSVIVLHGDNREVLRDIPDGSVDAVVTDCPYGLSAPPPPEAIREMLLAWMAGRDWRPRQARGFMGQAWDAFVPGPEVWVECLRVLKPGGHLLAFFGTRTVDLGGLAIRLAGFETRDLIAWLYGSGFPKSHDVSKAIDKAAGAVRAVVSEGKAVKRMIPGADQAVGGWEKNNGREFVPTVTTAATPEAASWDGWGTALKPALEPIVFARKPLAGTVAANVLEHGTGGLNIDACRIESANNPLTWSSPRGGIWKTDALAKSDISVSDKGRWPANVIHDGSDEVGAAFPETSSGGYPPAGGVRPHGAVFGKPNERGEAVFGGSDGSAARFFYSAKADAADRCGSKHPTVKPIDLMAYLCRLVTPPGGTVLDPFAGSGSTGMACLREGFDCILIEREAQFVADIHARLAHVEGADTPLFGGLA